MTEAISGTSLAAAWQGAALLLAPLLASALVLALRARLFPRRARSFTGDSLGATLQACEIACYLGFALAA